MVTDGMRTSIGLRKVAVRFTPPHVMVKILFVEVNFGRFSVRFASSEAQEAK